ncbi:hypothetical protein BDN72DRAFT_946503 [Pluteus cervinus]|uniref:Uncharacterized protein n=1 Tax=Pluteus cervinus TaxID=181527 RepID=A0ACD3A0N6_9AGAR|nr:hypothetical protein BDN72DRAFT_946503 [Pluteus cervinus]
MCSGGKSWSQPSWRKIFRPNHIRHYHHPLSTSSLESPVNLHPHLHQQNSLLELFPNEAGYPLGLPYEYPMLGFKVLRMAKDSSRTTKLWMQNGNTCFGNATTAPKLNPTEVEPSTTPRLHLTSMEEVERRNESRTTPNTWKWVSDVSTWTRLVSLEEGRLSPTEREVFGKRSERRHISATPSRAPLEGFKIPPPLIETPTALAAKTEPGRKGTSLQITLYNSTPRPRPPTELGVDREVKQLDDKNTHREVVHPSALRSPPENELTIALLISIPRQHDLQRKAEHHALIHVHFGILTDRPPNQHTPRLQVFIPSA